MTKQYGTPGPRAIYPEAAQSASLAACDPMAQLLFDRIIAACDDQGRMQAVIALVKAACLPLVDMATTRRIASWLDQLEHEGLIRRYDAGPYHLLQVVTWWKHQDGMRWVYPSRWPAADGWTDVLRTPRKMPPDVPHVSDDAPQSSADVGVLPLTRAPAGNGKGKGIDVSPPENGDGSLGGSADDEGDVLTDYYALTTRYPRKATLRDWLLRLAEEYGRTATTAALATEWQADSDPATLIGRTETRLAAAADATRRKRDRERSAHESARFEVLG